MQVIKAGVLASTKFWLNRVATFGSVSALLAAVAGVVASFRDSVGEAVAASLIVGSALILATTAIALAVFVGADLIARGTATAARHSGRADVIAAYFGALRELPVAPPVAPHEAVARHHEHLLLLTYSSHPDSLWVTRKSKPVTGKVSGLQMHDGTLEIFVVDDWFEAGDVASFTTQGPKRSDAQR